MKSPAAITTAGVAWLLTFFSATAGAQEQHPNLDRGFDPAKLYQFDQVDAIDLYNGRLTVQIPLGQRYQVGPALSYGLTLYYNSNVWDFEPAQRNGGPGEPCMRAEPRERLDRDWDAGMGWRLSLGELTFRPIAEDLDEWTYIGPDGADHRFYQTLHSGELRDPGHVYYYTRDGSYLRLVVEDESEPRQATVSFPDGTRQLFQENGDGSRRYRLARLLDPWSLNVVEVEYPVVPVVPGELWKLTDSFGRIQKAYTTWVGGSSPVVVDRVELTAFDGATLTYQFDYEIKNIRRSCKETCRTSSDPDWLVNVPLLTSLVAAAGTGELARREFQYYENTADCSIAFSNPPCGDTETFVAKDAPGVLKQLMLPTRGTITYAYEDRLLLQRDENRPCNLPDCRVEEVIEFATGVVRKVAHDPYGAQECGVWSYATAAHFGWVQHGQVWVSFLDELVTKVTSPAGDDTVHYFSGGIDPQTGTPQQWHTGLPFTPLRSDGGDRFLASEAFSGAATVACSGTSCVTAGDRKRAEFSVWEKDAPEPPGHPEYIGFNLNRRVSASRTYYTDDPPSACAVPSATNQNPPNPCRFAGVQSSAFDGLGHYRQQTTEGNFGAGDQRTTYTNYNPLAGTYPGTFTVPPADVPWILTTYDRIDSIDASGTARREYCFAKDVWGYPTTGFLLRQRALSRTDEVRSDKDLVTVLTPDNRGFLAEERFFGGDVQPVALGELCTLPLPASDQYRLVHTYQYGTRATTEYRDAAGAAVLRTLDRDIDQFTGLPRTERDVSGLLPTDFIYDALGRLTWARPAEGAWTRYRFYAAEASTDPNLAARLEVCTKANGDTRDGCAAAEPGWQDTLTRSAYRFNGFGRLFAERTRMPTATYGPEPAVPYEPGASTKWNERRTVYNAPGWKTGVSEVAANGSPPRWTTFSNFERCQAQRS